MTEHIHFVPSSKKIIKWITKWRAKLGVTPKRAIIEQALIFAIDNGFEPVPEGKVLRSKVRRRTADASC